VALRTRRGLTFVGDLDTLTLLSGRGIPLGVRSAAGPETT